MVKLIFPAIASLDGYIEDEDGKFDWAVPHEEVHAFINDLERPVGRIGATKGVFTVIGGMVRRSGSVAQSRVDDVGGAGNGGAGGGPVSSCPDAVSALHQGASRAAKRRSWLSCIARATRVASSASRTRQASGDASWNTRPACRDADTTALARGKRTRS